MDDELNERVYETLTLLVPLDPGRNLTLTGGRNSFRLFFKGDPIGEDLTLSDLKTISRNATTKYDIVQLVDVTQLVSDKVIKATDGYLKFEDGVPMVFLHVIHHIKFHKPDPMATLGIGATV